MFRSIPTNNKLCFDKQLKRTWKIHEQKMRNIKSSIGKVAPPHFYFLDQRAKRAALEDVRNIEIQKQNYSLLNKIRTIGQKGSKSSYLKTGSSCEKKRTLNQGYRKKQLVKIVQENQEIIKRINMKRSMYNVRKWQKQRKQIQKNISLISQFPYKNFPNTQTKVNLWMVDEEESKRMTIQNLSLSKSRINKQDLIFSGTHKIGQSYYLIETNIKNKLFIIEIENLQNMCQRYKLGLSQKQALEMIQKNFNGSIINLFNCLEINQQKGICELKCIQAEESPTHKSKKVIFNQNMAT